MINPPLQWEILYLTHQTDIEYLNNTINKIYSMDIAIEKQRSNINELCIQIKNWLPPQIRRYKEQKLIK